jgi:hypothetical protein
MRIVLTILLALSLTGCYSTERHQRDEAMRVARAAIEREKATADQRDRAILMAERAVQAGQYWKEQAEKCQFGQGK